jgi:hypothetical protein
MKEAMKQDSPAEIYLGDGPDWNDAFEAWWESQGQFCRAGGGDYEKTFAFRAWEAAINATPPAAPAAQPAVPEGWKMVPVEPTREMWTAVNKLDDQCATGNYDGKGCSIEQAWNCLLDAAPTPPAAQRKPLTVEKSAEMWVHVTLEPCTHEAAYLRGIKDAEAAHAVKEQPAS